MNMKRLLTIAVLALGALVACSKEGEKGEDIESSAQWLVGTEWTASESINLGGIGMNTESTINFKSTTVFHIHTVVETSAFGQTSKDVEDADCTYEYKYPEIVIAGSQTRMTVWDSSSISMTDPESGHISYKRKNK